MHQITLNQGWSESFGNTDHMGRRYSPRSVSMTSEQTVNVGGRIPSDSHPLIDLTLTNTCTTFDPPL